MGQRHDTVSSPLKSSQATRKWPYGYSGVLVTFQPRSVRRTT